MKMAIEDGRATRPSLEVGICGEHGGDPESIEWCHLIGNNYVSCSPFRVPVARLAAAQVAIKHSGIGAKGVRAKRRTPHKAVKSAAVRKSTRRGSRPRQPRRTR